jgi:FkbM family methyltransferase
MSRVLYSGVNLKDKLYLFYLRKLSIHPGKRKLRRLITNSFFNKGIEVLSDHGAKFIIKTFDYIDQKLIFDGCYEPETLRLCCSLVDSKDIFVDVGSNFGLYAINIAKKTNSKVFAVEPNPHIFNILSRNRQINKLSNIVLINAAIGETFAISGMSCPSMNNSGNYQISANEGEFFTTVVPFQNILDFFKIKTAKLLKIDIEGFELYALKGINWDSINIENIILEYIPDQLNKQNSSGTDCLQFLVSLGYTPFKIDGSKYSIGDYIPESNLWLRKIH